MLGNGMIVACLVDESAPLVSTALWLRAGTAHEPEDQAGAAHFLEHMMFRGSPHFRCGEIDRLTQAVGGSNNAFTSHDSTVYLFNLPSRHWRLALEIEADRMSGLNLEPVDVDAEREVILEEIAEVEDDPWDALEMSVMETFFGAHPYGRRILGDRRSLLTIAGEQLAALHRQASSPAQAVLTITGAVDGEVLDVTEELFAGGEGGARSVELAMPAAPGDLMRVVLERGDTRRGLLAMPSPPAADPEFVYLRLALTALCGGRASRLQRLLVDDGRLCSSVSSALTETVRPGVATLAVELLPGVSMTRVEEALLSELGRFRRQGVGRAAMERSRRLLLSEWLFAHETMELRGAALGAGLALFGADYAQAQRRLLMTASVENVEAAARRYLDPERGGVIGWAVA